MTLKWEDPPRKADPKHINWKAIRSELAANPGKWAKVATGMGHANYYRAASYPGYEARKVARADGRYDAWMRYIGDKEPGT